MIALHKTSIRFDSAFCLLLAVSFLTIPVRILFAWMTAVAVHELGHYLALVLCHIPVNAIRFGVSGADMQTRELTDVETLICAFAGPTAGFLLLLGARWHPVTSVCGFIHSAYNLLPFSGHDGDRMMGAACRLLFPGDNSLLIHNGIRVVVLLVAVSALLHILFS